jgi:hypothetical protein
MILYLLLQLCFLLLRCSHAATLHGPLPLDLPILHLRYPHTPWVFPGDTLPMKRKHGEEETLKSALTNSPSTRHTSPTANQQARA